MIWEIRFKVRHDAFSYPEQFEDIYQMIKNELRHLVGEIYKIELIVEEDRDS